MTGDAEPKTVMEFPLKFLLQEGGEELTGEATARLTAEAFAVMPKFGEALFISLRDVKSLKENDHRLELALSSGEKLTLFHLGYRFDDFTRELRRLRGEMMLKDLLMQEALVRSGLQGSCAYFGREGEEIFSGKCEPRLYETALVVVPENEEPFRVPYSYIDQVEEKDYTLHLATESGEKLVFSRMGRDFAAFANSLSAIITELSVKVQKTLTELLPEAGPNVTRRAARLMREGKAAQRDRLEVISPKLWSELERKLETAGISEEYRFLSSMARLQKICIGLKRGLLGDLTGEYIWFLLPLYSLGHNKPGNAVAMEAASGQGGGRATYFFRLTGRSDYAGFKDINELDAVADNFIAHFNRCMLAVNFRREPIYLPSERLDEPRFQKYKTACRKIPALQELRRLFIGRVFHRSPEQWQHDVLDLLSFNVSVTEDSLPWEKGKVFLEEEDGDEAWGE